MDGGSTEAEYWREIAAQKEREWKDVTEQRIRTLESSCEDKERQLVQERAKFDKLKQDFKYNLRLLAERDQELERYDVMIVDLKAQLNTRTAEVSECKIEVDHAMDKLKAEHKAQEEQQLHYQARLREKQAEIDAFKQSKVSEMQDERSAYESFKSKLQRRLAEVEQEMDAQKNELTTDFEDTLRKREHEFRLQADEMSAEVLNYELKAKLLGKEIDVVRAAQQSTNQEFKALETKHRVLEKRLKEKEWELQDLKAMGDANVTDLQNQLGQGKSALRHKQEEYERKHAEMDKYCREKEGALTAAKETFSNREAELQASIRDLQSKLEDMQVEIRRLQWTNQDLEKEKDSNIRKLQDQSVEMKERWDKQLVDVSRSQVSKDIELQDLRENNEKLRQQVAQKQEDIERYKKELSGAVERETLLEQGKAQLELDCQRRHEDLERQQYERSEDLIKKLTRSRDEANASLKEREREIQQRDSLIKTIQYDRQVMRKTLQKHNLVPDKNINVDEGEVEDLCNLEKQNASLKSVIREMRHQMEQLGHTGPARESDSQPAGGTSVTEDYVKEIEKDCRELREKTRELEQEVAAARKFGRVPAPNPEMVKAVSTEVKDNVLVRNHIQSLNDLIGSLRSEKVELTAQVKKTQAHIMYQEQTVERLTKEQREKQVEVAQLQFELGTASRRSQQEVASLRQRVSDLELQLVEARREADEYYKGSLERNMEVTALGQQLSGLKLDMAQKRPPINFGAQELLIQQLQDEIMSLRQKGSVAPKGDTQVQSLQQKLKMAAKKIAELAKERQHLIEIGNKLRSQLKQAGMEVPLSGRGVKPIVHTPDDLDDSMTSSHGAPENFMNKLNQLEKLQYQLTRQELQFAQKFSEKNELDQSAGDGPPSILKKPSSAVRKSYDTDVDVRASVNTEGGESAYSGAPTTARSQLMMSMSSMGGESLQEIWRMLDSPPPPSTARSLHTQAKGHVSRDNEVSSSSEARQSDPTLQLAGTQVSQRTGNQRPDKAGARLSDKAAGRVVGNGKRKPAIRNYNIRDNSHLR